MTHPMHSDACKCECDKLAERIRKIIAPLGQSNLVIFIQEALEGKCSCPPELLYKGDHYADCMSL